MIARKILVLLATAVALGVLFSPGSPASAAETRSMRIVKVSATSQHPAATFAGSVSTGVGPFSLSLEANATVGNAIVRNIPTGPVGIAEQVWPAGWSKDGYAILPDPDGTAVCSPDLTYGTDNIIPAGETPYLVCIRNSYSATAESRPLRIALATATVDHPPIDILTSLSTGQLVVSHLNEDEATSEASTTTVPTTVITLFATPPQNWRIARQVIVADPSGTTQCVTGLPAEGGPDIPPGNQRYLVCIELRYFSPESPRTLSIGVLAGAATHPPGTFRVRTGASQVEVTIPEGASASPNGSLTMPPPGTAKVAIQSLTPGWHVIGYALWSGAAFCSDVPNVSPTIGSEATLPPGSDPFLLCIHAAYLPVRVFAPWISRDAP